MAMPPIYRCVSLSHENEILKKEIEDLQNEIKDFAKIQSSKFTTSIAIQTELRREKVTAINSAERDEIRRENATPLDLAQENEALRRRLAEQTDLLKFHQERNRFRNGEKQNESRKLFEIYQNRLNRIEQEKQVFQEKRFENEEKLKLVENRIEAARKKLSIFDKEFFDEVRDLQRAVNQAIRLNGEYEKTIQLLAQQLSIDFAADEKF